MPDLSEANTATRFIRDVANHKLTILRDDGVERHLRCGKPGDSTMAFAIVTWPGYLCYTGDMGAYVFTRLPDMFQFFRARPDQDPARFDAAYWAEKLVATDRDDGHKRFSSDLFRAAIEERLSEYITDCGLSEAEIADLRERVDSEVLGDLQDNGPDAAYAAAAEFDNGKDQVFADFWERNCSEFTPRFLWCCHALRWAIGQYDAMKATSSEASRNA